MRATSKRPRDEGSRRRLVHLCARLPVGGMESVVAALLRHVPDSLYESTVWCLEETGALGRELVAEGRAVIELGKRRRRDAGLFLTIATLVRRHEIDLLHCHDELSWFYGAIGARLSGRPVQVIMTLHGRRGDMSARHRLEQRLLALVTSSVVSVSDFLRRQVMAELRLSGERITTIANGIDMPVRYPDSHERRLARERLGLPGDAVVIGSVGELSTVKNLDLTIEAAALARPSVPSLAVVFIGDGPHRQRLAEKAAALGLTNCLFAGIRRDVAAVLPAFDVYICSSDYEGISLAILEAMARGRAIVATNVGGNSELIQHDVTGVLVPRGDLLRLVHAIVHLTRDADRRERLGRGAQARVRSHFATQRMVQDYLDVYAGRARLRSRAQRGV